MTLEELLQIRDADDDEDLEKQILASQLVLQKAKHQFCDPAYRVHAYRFLYSFVYDGNEVLRNYISMLVLSRCPACVHGYQTQRGRLLEVIAATFDGSDSLNRDFLHWDLMRIEAALATVEECVYDPLVVSTVVAELLQDARRLLTFEAEEAQVSSLRSSILEKLSRRQTQLLASVCSPAFLQMSGPYLIPAAVRLIVKAPTHQVRKMAEAILDALSEMDQMKPLPCTVQDDIAHTVLGISQTVSDLLTAVVERAAALTSSEADTFKRFCRIFYNVFAAHALIVNSEGVMWIETVHIFEEISLRVMKLNYERPGYLPDSVTEDVFKSAAEVSQSPLGYLLFAEEEVSTNDVPPPASNLMAPSQGTPLAELIPVLSRPAASSPTETEEPPPMPATLGGAAQTANWAGTGHTMSKDTRQTSMFSFGSFSSSRNKELTLDIGFGAKGQSKQARLDGWLSARSQTPGRIGVAEEASNTRVKTPSTGHSEKFLEMQRNLMNRAKSKLSRHTIKAPRGISSNLMKRMGHASSADYPEFNRQIKPPSNGPGPSRSSADKSQRKTLQPGITECSSRSSSPGNPRREIRSIKLDDSGVSFGGSASAGSATDVSGGHMTTANQRREALAKARRGVHTVLATILQWNLFDLTNFRMPELDMAKKLPPRFQSEDQFRQSFRPLVLEECRCGIVQETLDKKIDPFPLRILKANRSSNWMTLTCQSEMQKTAGSSASEPSTLGMTVVTAPKKMELAPIPFRPCELLLLLPKNSPDNDLLANRTLKEAGAPPGGYLLGVSEKDERTDKDEHPPLGTIPGLHTCIIRILANQSTPKNDTRLPPSRIALNSVWIGYSVATLTTSIREFQSLFMSSWSPLFKYILSPWNSPSPPRPLEGSTIAGLAGRRSLPPSVTAVLQRSCKEYELNPSQASALEHAFSAENGVALLQGPPGTGKTKTLLAILSAAFEIASTKQDFFGVSRRILVCAPSNAAVDEIAARVINEGLKASTTPRYIRVGNPTKITREEVHSICFETRVNQEARADEDKKRSDFNLRRNALQARLDEIDSKLQAEDEMRNTVSGMDGFEPCRGVSEAYVKLKQEKKELVEQRKLLGKVYSEDRGKSAGRCRDLALSEADIVFATLSGAGSDVFNGFSFGCAIVDEAAQAVELSALIPLRHSISNLVLIGDPQQLPATVLSSTARKMRYERSLFQRLMANDVEVRMLMTQYRMLPEIAAFPAAHFYSSSLLTDESVCRRPRLRCSDFPALFGPFKFFHLPSEEKRMRQSVCNLDEVNFIVTLVRFLRRHYMSNDKNDKIDLQIEDVSVVTPYKAQLSELRTAFRRYPKEFQVDEPEVCTIDAFQGREKRIIIFSCVRSGFSDCSDADSVSSDDIPADVDSQQIESASDEMKQNSHYFAATGSSPLGFVSDVRRLNVAITRARDALWVVGNASTLSSHPSWLAMIRHAKTENKKLRLDITRRRGGRQQNVQLMGKPFVNMRQTIVELRSLHANPFDRAALRRQARELRGLTSDRLINEFFSKMEQLKQSMVKEPTMPPRQVSVVKHSSTPAGAPQPAPHVGFMSGGSLPALDQPVSLRETQQAKKHTVAKSTLSNLRSLLLEGAADETDLPLTPGNSGPNTGNGPAAGVEVVGVRKRTMAMEAENDSKRIRVSGRMDPSVAPKSRPQRNNRPVTAMPAAGDQQETPAVSPPQRAATAGLPPRSVYPSPMRPPQIVGTANSLQGGNAAALRPPSGSGQDQGEKAVCRQDQPRGDPPLVNPYGAPPGHASHPPIGRPVNGPHRPSPTQVRKQDVNKEPWRPPVVPAGREPPPVSVYSGADRGNAPLPATSVAGGPGSRRTSARGRDGTSFNNSTRRVFFDGRQESQAPSDAIPAGIPPACAAWMKDRCVTSHVPPSHPVAPTVGGPPPGMTSRPVGIRADVRRGPFPPVMVPAGRVPMNPAMVAPGSTGCPLGREPIPSPYPPGVGPYGGVSREHHGGLRPEVRPPSGRMGPGRDQASSYCPPNVFGDVDFS